MKRRRKNISHLIKPGTVMSSVCGIRTGSRTQWIQQVECDDCKKQATTA